MDLGRLCQLQRNPCKEVVIHEITSFLRGFPPFDAATEEVLEAVEEATEIEFFPVGAFVLRAGAGSSQHAYVVRTGHAELVDGGRVIDVVGPGDVVGLPSMLTNLAPGLDVRAAEDLLVYRVDADCDAPAAVWPVRAAVRRRDGAQPNPDLAYRRPAR
jgi:Predicted signal-transduction protein containing cAMP-binding and CBS domains